MPERGARVSLVAASLAARGAMWVLHLPLGARSGWFRVLFAEKTTHIELSVER